MRAWIPAISIIALASAAGLAAAQPPPTELLPPQPAPSGAPPAANVPPPVVLLPQGEAAPSSTEIPSDTAPAKPAKPVQRPRHPGAVLQALDKSTAETLRFEAQIGQPTRWKDLIFVVHVCEDAAVAPPAQGQPQPQRGAAAHVEIDSSPRPTPGRVTPSSRQLFKGWMFAAAPGLHPFEHPVYDAWLISCRAE